MAVPEALVPRTLPLLAGEREPGGGTQAALEAHELYVLLAGGDPAATQAAPVWRRIDAPCGPEAVPTREVLEGDADRLVEEYLFRAGYDPPSSAT